MQHISSFSRFAGSGDWVYTFTQEWPVPDEKHQLSFSLPFQGLHAPAGTHDGVGDVALNYRYQASGNSHTRVAFAPRLSWLLPTGRSQEGRGAGGFGIQVSLPLSWSWGSQLVTHWNAGATHTFSARDAAGHQADTRTYTLGQSLVWLARPRINLLLETSWTRGQSVAGAGAVARNESLYVSPGIRWAHDARHGLQVVPGLAFPIGAGPSRGQHAVFAYLSFEHPFRNTRGAP